MINSANDKLILENTKEGLVLTDGTLSMKGDFTDMIPRLRPNNLNGEILVRAAKGKGAGGAGLFAIDATAGMGEDALLLAAAGFTVHLYEKDPIIAALLSDSVSRARNIPELSDAVSRMTVIEGDSIEALKHLDTHVDVILLDPMFPKREKSGLIKKKFQLIQQLEKPCDDEVELLEAAITAHPSKIVIKRPAKGPFLAGRKPSYSINGKSIRYDVLVL